ncbi:unnamed protein product [Hyaloperonospora brassicae]|uniref:Uncharacterized protein n=1 Tax=Hyaloperonospora brassicae TaxID=162125 RepID=A0AAV0SWQ6_HYABA|nr:unnamed protein product [Hyaloperonospora brassicae]
MDILESREASLRSKVLGASTSPPAASALTDRLLRLHSQLDHLSAAVPGSTKLRELYEEHSGQLQLASAGVFANQNSRPGDELKRAAILGSADHLQQISAHLQQLQRLTSVLDQLRAPDERDQEKLTAIEAKTGLQSERALALHSRVNSVLATYQQMVLVLSEKCVEYSALLDQLQV